MLQATGLDEVVNALRFAAEVTRRVVGAADPPRRLLDFLGHDHRDALRDRVHDLVGQLEREAFDLHAASVACRCAQRPSAFWTAAMASAWTSGPSEPFASATRASACARVGKYAVMPCRRARLVRWGPLRPSVR